MKKILSILLSVAMLFTLAGVISVNADESWRVIFDWEKEGADKSEVTSTTVTLGDNKAVTVKELSAYNDGNYTMLQGSTKAIWFYNALSTSCNPETGAKPATVALPKLTGAKDLRVSLHIKDKSDKNYNPENMFIGVVINEVEYYAPLKKSDFFTASYYSFVGKSFTRVGTSTTKTILAEDVENITAIAGWVQTSGYSAILVDNIEYFGEEIDFSGFTPPPVKNIQYYKDNMNLEWSDEFDGDSLNTDNWNYQPESKHRNNQATAYKPANVEVKDGSLVLTARKETVTCSCDNLTEEQHQAKYNHSKTYNYTAGGIDSQHKKLFKQGLIETRVKCPEGSGTWCSVWMCGVDENGDAHWPFTGEIDIIEYTGQTPTQQFSSLHYERNQYEPGASYTRYDLGGARYNLPSGKFSSGYHTIGMLWSEKHVDFYIDDYVYQQLDIGGEEFYAFKDLEFYFLVTFPLGGSMAGTIDDSILPQSFSIDYIRYYQPYAAEVESVTSNSVTLKQNEGYQYSINGRKWQDSNEFTGLEPNTEYTLYQRLKRIDCFSGGSNYKTVKVKTLAGSSQPTSTVTNPTSTTKVVPTTVAPVKPVKIKLSKPEIKLKAGKKQFTVTYKKVKNAKKYKIYYKLKTAKKWKSVTIKGTKKTFKKLKKGKKYQVKVVAINGKYKSKASKTKTVTIK